jgi:glucose/arabinose dehydrogenase
MHLSHFVTSRGPIALIVLSFGAIAHAQSGPTLLDVNLGVRTVASGFTTPAAIAFPGPNEMFVIEKNTGQVKHVVGGVVQGVALDLAVNNSSERGLLGIALDPQFSTNKFVYLHWTCTAPAPADPFTPSLIECADQPQNGADTSDILALPLIGNRVDRFQWNGSQLVWQKNLIKLRTFQNDGGPIPPGQSDLGQAAAGNHNGGPICFGPDGKLYVFTGDRGRRGQLQNLPSGPTATGLGATVPDDQFGGPQADRAHFTGVILRLNSDGTTPPDNPFFATGAAIGGEVGGNLQRIFSYGHRNSFGMAFDPQSGNLWLQENGDDSFDEINRVPAAMNSGWIQLAGPSSRFAEFKLIETSPQFFGLQQQRWPPTNLASSGAEAISRLFMLPGAQYREPEFSWKFAVAPAGLGFQNGSGIGADYAGNLFVGLSTPALLGGSLLRFHLSGDRGTLTFNDLRLTDRVADNLAKNDPRESEKLLTGTNFGVLTDIQTSPAGTLYVVSLSQGAVYELFSSPATTCAADVSSTISISRGGIRFNPASGRYVQTLTIRNSSASSITGPFSIAFESLSATAAIFNGDGSTTCGGVGQSYVNVLAGADNILSTGETATVTVEFSNPGGQPIQYTPRVLAGKGLR